MEKHVEQLNTPVLEAALQWRDRSLIQDLSVFGKDSIWTMKNLRALWVALAVDSEEGSAEDSGSFLNVLSVKLADTPSEVARLCAEMLWVLFLSPVPAHIAASRKAEIIRTVYNLSGTELSVSHPLLKDPLTEGVANPGMSFAARRCVELQFLIKAVVAIKKLDSSGREALLSDAWKTGHALDQAAGVHFPQMTHMLRYLLFPQSYEPIFTRRSKRRITESFSGIPRKETKRWSITQLDEELLLAREQLQVLYETKDLSFNREPLLSTWQGHDGGSDAPSSERRYWVEICDVVNRSDRQDGRHALGKALWCPRHDDDGIDASGVMRDLEDGDVIFHFTDNEGITGVSLVTGEMDENFICPDDSDWRGEPGYRLALQEFVEVAPVLQPSAFLSESKFQDDLRRLAENYQTLFFNRQLTLNQGTYLSQAPESLVQIFDEAFHANSNKHLPHLEFQDLEDRPEPHQRAREQRRQQSLNQVLFGPSGTGKTYTAMVRAVEICDGSATSNHDDLMRRFRNLQSENRILLVTFHPSYGYADFIESVACITSGSPEEERDEGPALVKAGVFREIAERARQSEIKLNSPETLCTDQPIWKLALGSNEGAAYRDMIADGFITLHHRADLKFRAGTSPEAILEQIQKIEPDVQADDEPVTAVHSLTNQMKVGDLVILSDSELSYRAIGRISGDYLPTQKAGGRAYHQVRPVDWFASYDDSQSWHRISRRKFPPALLSQLDPSILRLDEVTALITAKPRQNPDNYVLLIDEIGRGDTAEIFGELITLIESDKRAGASNAMSAILPLSRESFDVPGNLYIIGTLNSVDGCCGLGDKTLRRRFEFDELMPDTSYIRGDDQLGTISDGNGNRIDLRALMVSINRRIDFLLGRNNMLGHAFFMHIRSFAELLRAMHHQVIPQLCELFDGDWSRVQLIFKDVLGDGLPNHPQIIGHELQSCTSIFGVNCEDLSDQVRYWVTPPHEMTPEALRKVYR